MKDILMEYSIVLFSKIFSFRERETDPADSEEMELQ